MKNKVIGLITMLILGFVLVGCGDDTIIYTFEENISFSELMERAKEFDSNGVMFSRFNRNISFYNVPAADHRTFYVAGQGLGPSFRTEATVGGIWQLISEERDNDARGIWRGQIAILRTGTGAGSTVDNPAYIIHFTLTNGYWFEITEIENGTMTPPADDLLIGVWGWGWPPAFRP